MRSQNSSAGSVNKKTVNLSIASQARTKKIYNKSVEKEEAITKNVQKVFNDRKEKQIKVIRETMEANKFKLYKQIRKDQNFDVQIAELEKERNKHKRKKHKKERQKLLKKNTIDKVMISVKILQLCFQHYKKSFYESDTYRSIRIQEVINEEKIRMLQKNKISQIIHSIDSKESQEVGTEPDLPTKVEDKSSIVPSQIEEPQFNLYSSKKLIALLKKFLESPFKDDKRFAAQFISQLTRDRINEAEDIVNALFHDMIFKLIITVNTEPIPKSPDVKLDRNSWDYKFRELDREKEREQREKDEIIRNYAFDILCNLIYSKTQRKKLTDEGKLQEVFEMVYKSETIFDPRNKEESRILEKLSLLVTLISYHEDMYENVRKLNLLDFVIKISDKKYSSVIRSNAVKAISMLTYNDDLFNELINNQVIDLIMEFCKDRNQDPVVKQYSTLALVHFALSKKSIDILIEKGVLNLFDSFGVPDESDINLIIQTNVSWIFLALCNNGITGKKMLEEGITRDMFLISCNPDYQQIRHLVITGFAELGRDSSYKNCDHLQEPDKQRMRETGIVKMHDCLKENARQNLDILLKFTASPNKNYQQTAYWALKDYILLTSDKNYVEDIQDIITSFMIGVLNEDDSIQSECASALSFLVTHRLVYKSVLEDKSTIDSKVSEIVKQTASSEPCMILDAVMYLSGNQNNRVRTVAFSTLSQLSKFSSACPTVMAQIERDIKIPSNWRAKQYYVFIRQRLEQLREQFYKKIKQRGIETRYSGLYSLLRLARHPDNPEIEEAINMYIDFIGKPFMLNEENHLQNESYFVRVFQSLKHTKNPDIIKKILKIILFYVNQDKSKFQKQIIDPQTILWMLEIMEHFVTEKYLCCLTASTLLSIVSKHEIHFYYQEVAIIKKFNTVLQNTDVFGSDQGDLTNENFDSSIDNTKDVQDLQENDESILRNTLSVDEKFEEMDIKSETENHSPLTPSAKRKKMETMKMQTDNYLISPPTPKIMSTFSQDEKQKHSDNPDSNQVTSNLSPPKPSKQMTNFASHQIYFSGGGTNRRQMFKGSLVEKKSSLNNLFTRPDAKSHQVNESDDNRSKTVSYRKVQLFADKNKAKMITKKHVTRPDDESDKIVEKDDEESESYETIAVDQLDPNDNEVVEIYLRDSLIKSFMVIFTNDKSQHLLLNKDLIDIAFTCLEYCKDCTLEAKRHVSRLISIIFKFPQVQERLLAMEVVNGIVHLLKQIKHMDIIRHTIKACTYISMNYDFIKESKFSLAILQQMLILLEKMNDRNDQFNIILTIKNILKGDKVNKLYFLDFGGTQKFTDIILNSSDYQIIEMCVSGIAEQASYKKVVTKILEFDLASERIKQIIKKCLEITDKWQEWQGKSLDKSQRFNTGSVKEYVQTNATNRTEKDQPVEDDDEDEKKSIFSYSVNENNFQIPQFMKNDLDRLHGGKVDSNEFTAFEEEFKLNVLGKVRKSAYYIVARSIKFGMEVEYFMSECDLSQKIIKDLTQQQDNKFLFQNILLVISNLAQDTNAIVKLVGNDFETIIGVINNTRDKDRRISLLKVLINLILQASEQLSNNGMLFQRMFEISKDQKSDESMIENILWMATSLCEQSMYNQNFTTILHTMIHNQIMLIIWKCLCSKQERIILQTLKLITCLCDFDEFRSQLFDQTEVLNQIKEISINTENLTIYKLEIQTAICLCLDKITLVKDISKQSSEIKQIRIFNKYLINLALQMDYVVRRADVAPPQPTEPEESRHKTSGLKVFKIKTCYPEGDENVNQVNHTEVSREESSRLKTNTVFKSRPTNQSTLKGVEQVVLDDIERIQDCNQMVENIICCLRNISSDNNMQTEIIANGYIDVVKKFIDLFLDTARECNDDGINEKLDGIQLSVMPTGTINLIKAIVITIMNISSNTDVHHFAVHNGLIPLIKNCLLLHDYEVMTNLIISIGNFCVSSNSEIRKKMVRQGLLQELIDQVDSSQFFRIKRICTEFLGQIHGTDPSLFELNDLLQQTRIDKAMLNGDLNIDASPGAM